MLHGAYMHQTEYTGENAMDSENGISRLVFIAVVESVYSAVRADSLYKADHVSSLKG